MPCIYCGATPEIKTDSREPWGSSRREWEAAIGCCNDDMRSKSRGNSEHHVKKAVTALWNAKAIKLLTGQLVDFVAVYLISGDRAGLVERHKKLLDYRLLFAQMKEPPSRISG